LIEKPTIPEADFRYRIFNSDGGEVEQCGNGSRCFVKFVREKGLTNHRTVKVQVAHTILSLTENDDGQVTVDMGLPILSTDEIPFNTANFISKTEGSTTLYELKLSTGSVWINPISMGNPHAVQIVKDVNVAAVATEGPEIESLNAFPNKVNAGFMQIQNRHKIKLRVFERGSGETLACGTGACAAAVSGILRGELDSPVVVHTRGGDLTIAWDLNSASQSSVMMTGPAQTVFEGEITIE
jgi:diaminopimelate epimerase